MRGPVGRNHGRALAPLAGAIAVLAVATGALALAAPAGAVDHNIRIREVFAGATTGQPGARFVELQMATGNQNRVGGNEVDVYNAAGTNVGAFTFPAADLPNGTSQASILVATSQAASFFGVTPDLAMGAVVPPKGGQVCYDDVDLDSGNPPAVRDCVAWGNFTGASPSPTGNPFGPISGILDGRSILRDISAGNPALLEVADDTNDSANDFSADFPDGFPSPRNNAGDVTTTASTAAVDGDTVLNVNAVPGVKNRLTVAASGAFWRLTDQNAPITAGAGCEQVFVNRIRCLQSGVGGINIDAGDLNDQVTTADGVDATVDGGAGDDRITTKNAADELFGGLGRDILNGGTGPDLLDGGENQDTVTYDNRTAGQDVVVDIDGEVGDDGGPEDGAENARDTVAANVEILKGGAGDDSLTGSSGPNKLFGFGGEDQLHGLGANDQIRAKDGGTIDTITCGAGPADRLFADLGVDIFPTDGPDACEIVS
jgi:hypothetical protein